MNNKFSLVAAFAAIALATVMPTAAQADFINGNFEAPYVGDNTYVTVSGTDVVGWSYDGDGALVANDFDGSGSGTTWWSSPDGGQCLYLAQSVADNVTISQSVALNAGDNTLTFLQADFASSFETPGGAVLVTILNPDSSILVGPTLFTTTTYSNFIQQTLAFNAATAGSYNFEFTSVGGQAGILDDVSVGGAAPEPASIALLGLGAVALVRRRRTTRA